MPRSPKLHASAAIDRALDEVRFGAARTLNLRTLQPTAVQAVAHAEQWLRLMQVQGGSRDVLVITGRGNQSVEGWSPVREAVMRLLPSLRRRNVITGYAEHTAGSFVVTLAPMRALFEAPKRRREPKAGHVPLRPPAALSALDGETITLLRELAQLTLSTLGIQAPSDDILRDEMQRQYAALAAVVPDGADREAILQQAIQRAVEEFEG